MSWRGTRRIASRTGMRFPRCHGGPPLTLIREGLLMTRHPPLDEWIGQVAAAFPKLSRPQTTVLALYSFGMILAQRCGLNSVVTVLVPLLHVGFHTLRSRLQEFY